jgi:chromosome segregation ATPase
LLQSWEQEIAEGGKQIELLDQRIALKGEIIAQLTSELDNTNALQQKGLSTNSRALEAWRRLAEEREDLLALENAKLTARRAIGMAERTRLNHLSEQRQTALVQLQNAKSRLASAQQNYLLSLNEIALLTGGLDSLSNVTGGASIVFEILGPRAESFAAQVVTINTELMPGDILVVSADLAG